MEEDLISGTIYTEFDDVVGPDTILCEPSNLPEHIQKLVSIKTMTLLAGEEDYIPDKILMVSFPSLNMKGMVKYIEWKDEERRAGAGWGSITLLFKEFDDLIFYKYKEDLKPTFNEIAENLIKSKDLRTNVESLSNEFKTFYEKNIDILNNLRKQELSAKAAEAFPEDKSKTADIFDYKFKLIVCGDPGVGKTSTILRFTENAFTRTYIPTIGVNITEKNVKVGDSLFKFILWDIAGQEKFRMMRRHFYQGSEGIFLIFDLTYKKTFNNIPSWHQDLKKNLGGLGKLTGFLIGNKSDLIDQRQTSKEEGLSIAKELGLEYMETSALTGDNVNDSFIKIAETFLSKK